MIILKNFRADFDIILHLYVIKQQKWIRIIYSLCIANYANYSFT